MWDSELPTALFTFMAVSAVLFLLLYSWLSSERWREQSRWRELRGEGEPPRPGGDGQSWLGGLALQTFPKISSAFFSDTEDRKARLEQRLLHAGYYNPHAPATYLGIKVSLVVASTLAVLAINVLFPMPLSHRLLAGCLVAMALLLPSFWLESRKKARQEIFRRALPDALDVMVICLDAGQSLAEAIRQTSAELATAHPELAREFNIVQHQMLLGMSAGESLRKLGQRSDLEEVRTLATVLLQAEKFGTSVSKTLRIQADQLRWKRQQRAEEKAQQAAVLIIFPTLLCIFPAVFVVLIGPAVFRIVETFGQIRN